MKKIMTFKVFKALLAGVLLIAGTSISLYAAEWKYAMGEGESDPQGIYATAILAARSLGARIFVMRTPKFSSTTTTPPCAKR